MIFLGIDPGASGGLAWIIPHPPNPPNMNMRGLDVIEGIKMPETERDTWLHVVMAGYPKAIDGDVYLALDPLREEQRPDAFAIIESVHSMPKQGVASSFKFGRSYGFLRGCLIASGIPFEEVTPQRWQKELGCLSKGNKNVTKARAQQLFPSLKITHATADALLLAEYARRLYARRNPTAPSAS